MDKSTINGRAALAGGHTGSGPAGHFGRDNGAAADPALWRRQIRHDIHHELATIMMLASAVAVSDDVGPDSRKRVEQLLGETRWLDQLLRRLDDDIRPEGTSNSAPRLVTEHVPVDRLAGEVVHAIRLSRLPEVAFEAEEAWAHLNRLAFWRALRNIMDNACRVAGDDGHIVVSVLSENGWTIVQVDDSGPGFGRGSRGRASLGLGIVHDFVAEHGGSLELRQSDMGGGCVRMVLPAAPPPDPETVADAEVVAAHGGAR